MAQWRGDLAGRRVYSCMGCWVHGALAPIKQTPATEIALHDLMGRCFDAEGILYQREVQTETGPVDFVIAEQWAVEVKIKGSPLALARQITRYLEDERFAGGIIVTTKAMSFPIEQAHGKPVRVIELWRQFV